MKERPILFSAPMVRALLAGTKTQTRRVVKHDPQLRPHDIDVFAFDPERGEWEMGESHMGNVAHVGWVRCPYGAPGDHLWCRETWRCHGGPEFEYLHDIGHARYRADSEDFDQHRWKPSIFMPRWASRLTLEVVSVRVERLNDISEADAVAEGCAAVMLPEEWFVTRAASHGGELISLNHEPSDATIVEQGWSSVRHEPTRTVLAARDAYRNLWESINGDGSWARNPWVWVVEFRRLP